MRVFLTLARLSFKSIHFWNKMGLNYRGKALSSSPLVSRVLQAALPGSSPGPKPCGDRRFSWFCKVLKASVMTVLGSGSQCFWITFILSARNYNKSFCCVQAGTGQQQNLGPPSAPGLVKAQAAACQAISRCLPATGGLPPAELEIIQTGAGLGHVQAEVACSVKLHLRVFLCYTVWTAVWGDWSETTHQSLLWHIGAGGGWRCLWPKGREFPPGYHSLSLSPFPHAAAPWNGELEAQTPFQHNNSSTGNGCPCYFSVLCWKS